MSGIIKSSAKILAIAALAIGFSAMGFAKGGASSIVTSLNNQAASNNTAPSPSAMNSGHSSSGGSSGGHSSSGGSSGGSTGGHGSTGGGGHNPPGCVPEPATMLVMGLGAGFMALKKRAKKA